MRLSELPMRIVIEGRVINPPKTAKQRASDGYYQRNRDRLKARALARWRQLNGKTA